MQEEKRGLQNEGNVVKYIIAKKKNRESAYVRSGFIDIRKLMTIWRK